ncbi:hypothetical protein JI58_01045 [Marinosulfonomonas sp. PRT-SC04]|nr:hypothetical protein JI58_01045 [Marinosulfonomonas sp. PRT-SC04]
MAHVTLSALINVASDIAGLSLKSTAGRAIWPLALSDLRINCRTGFFQQVFHQNQSKILIW